MYSYTELRPTLFTEEGVEKLTTVRRTVKECLEKSGAVRAQEAWKRVSGDSWLMIACLDYMVEKGELREVTFDPDIATQHKVYVAGRTAL